MSATAPTDGQGEELLREYYRLRAEAKQQIADMRDENQNQVSPIGALRCKVPSSLGLP